MLTWLCGVVVVLVLLWPLARGPKCPRCGLRRTVPMPCYHLAQPDTYCMSCGYEWNEELDGPMRRKHRIL